MILPAGILDKQIRIERPVADDAWDGAGSGTWEVVDTVWAQVQDVMPSRGERSVDGLNLSARPARVRMRYRDDVTPSMRFVLDSRVMQIVSGPAELGRRDGLECMVEDYQAAGNPA